MNIPASLLYTNDHIWVKKEDGTLRIGVTEHAQSELGDIVFIELPEQGDQLKSGEPFGSAESVKTVSELYSPFNGKVIEKNSELEDKPELVNESPYEDAWMLVIEPENEADLDGLMTSEQYHSLLTDM
ncbi:glycine cleavage system H protein [Gracilibacillus halotolerans]|uniref:Glycine cleavage system H protein n=1 Tax=Gracilibacillus halotolerans TaxID=74386 RepID=A0A841RS66_9BACI|nr:glycine cleavage system protein GcvH [Gracilibacillus halotolerans]MBB6513784.1 glycine cleavage system H protein [Gracilibacillus halotolerans]